MQQQQERVKKAPTPIEKIPAPEPTKRAGSSPWVIGALVVMTAAFLALGGWTMYQRLQKSDAEGLAQSAVAAWDSAKPGALAQVYDSSAVLVDANGNKIVGLDAIAAAVAIAGRTSRSSRSAGSRPPPTAPTRRRPTGSPATAKGSASR